MDLYNSLGYVDIPKLVGLGVPYNLIYGARGTGKTFGAIKYGIEYNHNFIFNMDDRFGEFKPGKNFVYNANTDDKDFIIPTEDDMKLQNKTNNWESDWMLWGWSKIQHGYHLGETAFSLVTGNTETITIEDANLFNNSAYYSNSSD